MARRGYWQTVVAQRVRQVAGLKDIDQAITKIAEDLVDGLGGASDRLGGAGA